MFNNLNPATLTPTPPTTTIRSLSLKIFGKFSQDMILFLLLTVNNALAETSNSKRDPIAFSVLLTERLNSFFEIELDKRGMANDFILSSLRICHNQFKRVVPDILLPYDHVPFNSSLVYQVAEASRTKMQDKLNLCYWKQFDYEKKLQSRSDIDTVLNKLHTLGIEDLLSIRQFSLDPALFDIQQYHAALDTKRLEILSGIHGFEDFPKTKLINFFDMQGVWDFLKTVDKTKILELLNIEHELEMAKNISNWIENVSTWIDEYTLLDSDTEIESHIQIFTKHYATQVELLGMETVKSMDEILRSILSTQDAHADFITELLESVENLDRSYNAASHIFKRLSKELKTVRVKGVLTSLSTTFFLFFGFTMLIFYFSGEYNLSNQTTNS